jgi:hypothetical protein
MSANRTGFLDRPVRRPITVDQNHGSINVEIRLQPQSVIIGHVLDEGGGPVDRAQIAIFKQTYRNGGRMWERLDAVSQTNDAGEFRFSNLRTGRYLLQAHNTQPPVDNRYGDPPKAFYVPAYYPDALSQDRALPVIVGVGEEVRNVDIRLAKVLRRPSVRVRGRVTGVQPDSTAIVSVSLLPADGGGFGGGSTLASPPEYIFDLSVPLGQYTVFAQAYSGGPEVYGTAVLTVAGEAAGLVLAMRPAPDVTGRISVVESGVNVNLGGIIVALARLPGSNVTELRSDARGRFSFPRPVSPGHYAIANIRSIADGCFVREVKLGDKEISWDDFEISATSQMEIILSNTAGKIRGSVFDAEGRVSLGSSVTLIPLDGRSRPLKQSVDDDGNFQFTNLRPGKYKVFAWEELDDDLWQDPEFRKEYESRATEVTVAPGETQNARAGVIAADAVK